MIRFSDIVVCHEDSHSGRVHVSLVKSHTAADRLIVDHARQGRKAWKANYDPEFIESI